MSFTDINHFSISLSFSYWNITAGRMTLCLWPADSAEVPAQTACSKLQMTSLHARRPAGWAGRQGDCLVVPTTSPWPSVQPDDCLVFYSIMLDRLCRRCRESVVTTQLWITKVMPQATPSVPTAPPPCLHCTQWGDRQNSHMTISTVEWKKGLSLNIGYLRAATCTFFTNLARWKFPYENRTIISSRRLRRHSVL